MTTHNRTRTVPVFGAADVRRCLPMADCIAALENAFNGASEVRSSVSGVAAENGKFHIKAAYSPRGRSLFAAKINANFPGNPSRGAPTIQGILILFDADNGDPLALVDSMSITALRTAAASAVAARRLAPEKSTTLAIVGCGAQALPHLEAMRAVRDFRQVIVFDRSKPAVQQFVAAASSAGIPVSEARDLSELRSADVIVTSTSSREPFLEPAHVRPGAFVAAVGADSPDKAEITAALYAAAFVIADDVEQCAASGDLRTALKQGASAGHVRGTLADLVARPDRFVPFADQVRLFDSTGIPIEDVAAAAALVARAASGPPLPRVSLG